MDYQNKEDVESAGRVSGETASKIIEVLKTAPILSEQKPQNTARLASHADFAEAVGGETLFQEGSRADRVYLIVEGAVQLTRQGRELANVARGFVGLEAVVGRDVYITEAIADSSVKALSFPGRALLEHAPEHAAERFYRALFDQCVGKFEPMEEKPSQAGSQKSSVFQTVGWLTVLAAPALVYAACSRADMDSRSVNFLTIFTATTVMWIFRLMPEFIPAVFLVLSSIILGVAPFKTVLSGFSSGSFFMALSVFGLGYVLVRSGLTYRLALWLLKRAPPSRWGYETAMLAVGALLTPVLPSANGRVALTQPLLEDIYKTLRYRRGGVAVASLSAAAFSGLSLFSAMFLTSKSINFAVYDLFPAQVKYQFTWGYWLFAALAAGAVLLAGHYLFSALIFRSEEKPQLLKESVRIQRGVIGPMDRTEWIAFLGISLFIIGALSSSLHKIQPPWIGLAILYLMLSLGVLSKQEMRRGIDWPFLLMLAGMISIVKTMSALGLDKELSKQLTWLGAFMAEDIYLFAIALAAAIFIIRLIVPNNATVILMCTLLLPIADEQGVSPWVVAFYVLLISDGWFMPYQCSYYIAFREEGARGGAPLYGEKRLLVYNACINATRVIAALATIPFWRMIGLL